MPSTILPGGPFPVYDLDTEGNVVEIDTTDPLAFARVGGSLGTPRYRIAFTEHDDVSVSTVFIAFNLGGTAERPLVFETMVFKDGDEEETHRWATHQEALSGHENVIRRVFGQIPLKDSKEPQEVAEAEERPLPPTIWERILLEDS